MSDRDDEIERRVLLLPPTARDAAASKAILESNGLLVRVCSGLREICREAGRGAGAVLITREALASDAEGALRRLLDGQPPWSDLPLIVLTPSGREHPRDASVFDAFRNVTLVKRPVEISVFTSTVRAALRDRMRQYEVRAYLEALREADRRKDEFLAILAHELRNPLAAIGNAAQVALRDDADPEALSWSREVIARQVKNLSIMIDDLLDVSRINQGKIQLKQEPLHLGPVIARAVEAVSHIIEEKKHELNVTVATGSVQVKADATRLEQVVTNLIANAAKYTDPGGSISVTASPEEEAVAIRVKDNGIGLTREMLGEVFELFAQADKTLDRARGGLGIGLAVVKKLVEMHGGSVEASSEGPGEGSEFAVRLPALTDAIIPAGEGSGRRREARSSRILVVDDGVDTAIGLARLLRMSGHVVEIAHDGDAAVAAARAFLPEVLLLDIGLPGLNGYEVAALLRREEAFKKSVFIAVSGYDQENDRERARSSGFDHHISKPVDFGSLIELIATTKPGGSK